jgi:8-oxo-dGTP pyrophosphatase MutT (NUDIX family)
MPISPYIAALRQKIGHDPLLMPAVCVLIFNEENEILLTRQHDDGLWHTIGGAIDPHEEPAAAAIREAKEETCLDLTLDRIVGVYAGPYPTYKNGDQVMYVTIAFAARVPSGQAPQIGDDESMELKFFALDALPPLWEWDHRAILQAARNEPAAFHLK